MHTEELQRVNYSVVARNIELKTLRTLASDDLHSMKKCVENCGMGNYSDSFYGDVSTWAQRLANSELERFRRLYEYSHFILGFENMRRQFLEEAKLLPNNYF